MFINIRALRASRPVAGVRTLPPKRRVPIPIRASTSSQESSSGLKMRTIKAQKLTKEAFAPFGQVCEWQEDMKLFDGVDAQLDLSQGTPRFYLMRIPAKGLDFKNITHHKAVTQCLGGLSDKPWFMAMAASSVEKPSEENMAVFEIPPGVFVKMNKGTWHAGPLFSGPDHIDFYNLELKDTNLVDHHNYFFSKEEEKSFFRIVSDAQ
jgi:ureidoglycolate hydrolase